MATAKTRIAAYLEPTIEEKLREYQKTVGLNDSEAINAILAEFFSVSKTLGVTTLRKIIREEIQAYLKESDRNG